MALINMGKKQWLKMALIIVAITVLRTMVQPFIPSDGPSPFPQSAIVEAAPPYYVPLALQPHP